MDDVGVDLFGYEEVVDSVLTVLTEELLESVDGLFVVVVVFGESFFHFVRSKFIKLLIAIPKLQQLQIINILNALRKKLLFKFELLIQNNKRKNSCIRLFTELVNQEYIKVLILQMQKQLQELNLFSRVHSQVNFMGRFRF